MNTSVLKIPLTADEQRRFRANLRIALLRIPGHLQDGLERYVCDGIRPGSFLCACIANNALDVATKAADKSVLVGLPDIMRVLYNDCPPASWGSHKALEAWIAQGGHFGGRS